jgi:spermidine synthase
VLLWQAQWTGRWRTVSAVAAIAMAVALVAFPPSWNRSAMTRGLYRNPSSDLDVGITLLPLSGVVPENLLYYRDGINSTVSVHYDYGEYSLRVNGKADASSSQDMSTQVLLGELGLLFGPRAERVMVVGLASGITVGSVALHDPERVDVIELEPAMIAASHFFDAYNHHPLEHPNVRVIADDGRNYIEYTRERYDVIISEPSNPWITGASNLFTREFFHAAHAALRPKGRLLQWVQLYALDPPALRAIIAALHAEFPYVYGFAQQSGQPDLMLLAGDTALQRADFPVWENLSEPVRDDLRRINTFSTADLWSLLRLTPSDVQAIADASPVRNSDDNMFVELRAPWALHDDNAASANWEVLNQHSTDVVTLVEQIGARLDVETIGEIALSYASVREDQRSGQELVRVADARGTSAHALAARAALRLQEDSTATEEAQHLLDRAVELRPDLFAPRLQRARLHALADEAASAFQDADAALAASPGDLRARYVRTQALNALGRSSEVYQEAQALLDTPYATWEPQVRLEAASAAAAAGHYDEGIRELRKYLDGHMNSGSEWQLLAAMYDHTGQAALAQEARDNAEKAQRNIVLTLHRDARRALRFGNADDAVRYLRTALLFDSTYEPARQELRHLGVSRDSM